MTTITPPPATNLPSAIPEAVRGAAISFFASVCDAAPVEKTDQVDDEHYSGIMGVISFIGEPNWSFALVLPKRTAETMARKFAGFDIPFDSPDMGDVVGELVNVMAGDIVARLDGAGISAQMSLPTIARGYDVELLTPSEAYQTKMYFASSEGNFSFKVVGARRGAMAARRPGQ